MHFYANNAISHMPYMGQIAQGGCKYARSAILVHTMVHIAKNSHAKFCHTHHTASILCYTTNTPDSESCLILF